MSTPTPALTASGTAPVVVFAIGNPSRGDDAIGPLLGERLMAQLQQHACVDRAATDRAMVEVIIEQQLVVEHVLDLVGRQQALFIDAAAQGAEVASLAPITPAETCSVMSHRLSPATLLGLYGSHLGHAPPPAALLSVVGSSFELGAGLSAQANKGLDRAWAMLQTWLASALFALPVPSARHPFDINPAAVPPKPALPATLE